MLHLKQWHYSFHRDFQNCILHEEVLQDSSAPILQGYPYPYIIHQSREFSIQNPILHTEDKELFKYYYIQRAKRPSVQKRNSTHRRQGDLLEIHPCTFPGIPATRPSKGIPVMPDIHDLPASPGNSTSSSISRESTPFQHSPIRMHILHIPQVLQFDWFSQKTPPSTSWTVQNTNYKHSFSKEREML